MPAMRGSAVAPDSLLTFSWHAGFPPVYRRNASVAKRHIFAHAAFQLTSPMCCTCCVRVYVRMGGGVQFVMKQAYHQSLSAASMELPFAFHFDGYNPNRDRPAHLIKRSEPHRQIICTGETSMIGEERKKRRRNLSFKPEPGQFVLWLSRQWSALNSCEDCCCRRYCCCCWGPGMNTKSHGEDGKMPSQQVEV